ncbi:hypothetical protein [Ferruginibacter sp. HRS2-29]|uniref:hypothetical protein n=1 Tax=Ferruginibacter sp. HRS2-29 TaxID=2487334 RepID=UPI0020CC62B6|nr:hypothetical protein [Ferruginibacter sp. HRS2-29]MCP9750302.1 hypothetical protein [Ferruginibacter sp. HRS2-29]
MNSNFRVRNFVLISVALYLVLSLIAGYFNWPDLRRVNLVANVFTSGNPDSTGIAATSDTTAPIVIQKIASKDFNLYKRANLITSFNSDTTKPSLYSFVQKLHELKSGKKRKIRIGYFGDSMIEGDLLSQTLRKLMQGEFGGAGVGFVPVSTPNAGSRATVIHTFSNGWEDENFKENSRKDNLYLSGHTFHGNDDWFRVKDQTVKDSSAIIEKSLLCGTSGNAVTVMVDGTSQTIHPVGIFNRIPLRNDVSTAIKIAINDESLPVYGVSFESASGIIVDNFTFRGITGVEYNKIDSNFLKAVAEGNPYDLIIFQYGVNLMFRPNDMNFNWYAKIALPAIKKLKAAFPQADFLMTSTADRAFNYGGEYKSAVGIDTLIKVQASLAYETGSIFYNHFETMGGHDAIVRWAAATPSLANKDYVHPNARGADILGHYLFEAIMKDYHKLNHTK